MKREPGLIAFGIFAVLVGVGSGYFMITHPEGLNPEWSLGMAMVVPAIFTLAGLIMIGNGLGRPRFTPILLLAVMFGLLAIVNYGAFFTDHFGCRGRLSFLGLSVLEWYPSEAACRNSLRVIMAVVDAFVAFLVVGSVWYKYRTPRRQPSR